MSKQEYFQVKFEVAQFTLQSQICVLIKINQDHVFEKSLSDFVFLCRDLNAHFEGNNSIIDQLMNLVNDNLVIPMARDPQMR